MVDSLINHAGLARALAGCPEDVALACRAALKALEATGDVRDAAGSLRELAIAFAAVAAVGGEPLHPRSDNVVATRTNWATATCSAPNCAGHRVRA